MHFEFEMPENGITNRFRDKQTTNKIPLNFLDAEVLTEM